MWRVHRERKGPHGVGPSEFLGKLVKFLLLVQSLLYSGAVAEECGRSWREAEAYLEGAFTAFIKDCCAPRYHLLDPTQPVIQIIQFYGFMLPLGELTSSLFPTKNYTILQV